MKCGGGPMSVCESDDASSTTGVKMAAAEGETRYPGGLGCIWVVDGHNTAFPVGFAWGDERRIESERIDVDSGF